MGVFSFVKAGKKIFNTVKSVKPNVGNLKKNQETMGKLKKTTDAYVTTAKKKGFEGLAKDLRQAGSKSLQKTDKILRKGGRKNLKFGGGADMGSKKLSPKQMKIAKLAGDPKKIDGPDFAKLRGKKS